MIASHISVSSTRRTQEDEDDTVYEIEDVDGHRIGKDGRVEWSVKWKGYPESANTWEPIDSFTTPGALDTVAAYLSNEAGEILCYSSE